MHGPHRRSNLTLFLFQGLRVITQQRTVFKNETREPHTQSIRETRNRKPQPHFQRKREAAEEAAENLSSSEESLDRSESEPETVEGAKMDAEGESTFLYDETIFFLRPAANLI